MADRRGRPRSVEAYVHYYSVSVAFTKDHLCRMALGTFHFSPRAWNTESLGWIDANHYSANVAAQILNLATSRATTLLVPEPTVELDYSQLTLPLD